MKGWELMALATNSFPPTKHFENYLWGFLNTGATSADPTVTLSFVFVCVLATVHCVLRLDAFHFCVTCGADVVCFVCVVFVRMCVRCR